MFSGLLIILVPLIVGYLIPLRQQAALKVINQLLSWMVYLILFTRSTVSVVTVSMDPVTVLFLSVHVIYLVFLMKNSVLSLLTSVTGVQLRPLKMERVLIQLWDLLRLKAC